MTSEDLHTRRVDAVRAWTRFVPQGDETDHAVRPEILDSWQLSGVVSPTLREAPLADEGDTAEFWRESPLQTAVSRVQDELKRTAEDGDLVIAITDEHTRILWTYGGRVMRRKAETVNFVAGGRWDEASVGTNALAIAALVAAILWICGVGSLAGVVLGVVALMQIKKSGQSGRGLAIGGIVVGALGLLATIGTFLALAVFSNEVSNDLEGFVEKQEQYQECIDEGRTDCEVP